MGSSKKNEQYFEKVEKRKRRKLKNKNMEKEIGKTLNVERRKQWWSAQLALDWPMFHAITGTPSGVLPFMSSRRDRKWLCCSFCSMVSRFCLIACSPLIADLTFHGSAWLRITVQSLHSLKGPPIARLSAPALGLAFSHFLRKCTLW